MTKDQMKHTLIVLSMVLDGKKMRSIYWTSGVYLVFRDSDYCLNPGGPVDTYTLLHTTRWEELVEEPKHKEKDILINVQGDICRVEVVRPRVCGDDTQMYDVKYNLTSSSTTVVREEALFKIVG